MSGRAEELIRFAADVAVAYYQDGNIVKALNMQADLEPLLPEERCCFRQAYANAVVEVKKKMYSIGEMA